jgi:excisionase family DNA binding protein
VSKKQPLTVQEAAARVGLSESRILARIKTGVLPAKKFGRAWSIDPEDLARLPIYGKPGRPKAS